MTPRDHEHLYAGPTMGQLAAHGLSLYDDRPCLSLGETVASYRDVRRRTSQFVQALAARGVGAGSPVAVLSANRPEVLYNLAAMMISGACGTPLHPMGSLQDHAHVCRDAGIQTLVYDPSRYEARARALKERVPSLRHLLSFGPAEGGEDYCALADGFEPRPLVAAARAPDEIAAVAYTGGTTGRPKGVMSTVRAGTAMTQIQLAEWEFPRALRLLLATPLSHAAAALFVPTLLRGGTLYASAGFSPAEFFADVERHRITATFVVPAMIYSLLDAPEAADADMSSMETVFYGASPIQPARLAEAVRRWGKIFFQCYGQSEAPMVLSHLKRADHDLGRPERLSSCGRPSPFVQLALLDEGLRPVPPGHTGEICVRGPLVMAGYHNLADETAAALAGGWLHTGDIGRLDEDGYLYIVDRKKDLIITGGFNVFPREVEDVIGAHPDVAQVAVIGVPDERWGEAVKALVVPRPGHQVDPAELVALVKRDKGPVHAPKSVELVDALPLSPVGKPDKRALRARYWGDRPRAVS